MHMHSNMKETQDKSHRGKATTAAQQEVAQKKLGQQNQHRSQRTKTTLKGSGEMLFPFQEGAAHSGGVCHQWASSEIQLEKTMGQ